MDLATSPTSCGACGHACAGGEACVQGSCVAICAAPLSVCTSSSGAATCADLRSDPTNCGGCARSCPSGQVCSSGVCALTCAPPLTTCGDGATMKCKDLVSDPANCGTCGHACQADEVCQAGVCRSTCAVAHGASCGTACVDLRSDDRNCGACGNACGAGTSCQAGTCVLSCPIPQIVCGGACLDPRADVDNCGACGHACGAGAVCRGGACAAAPCQKTLGLPAAPVGLPAVGGGLHAALADLDGDSVPELISCQYEATLQIRHILAHGQIGPGTIVSLPGVAAGLAAGDLDGDGDGDLVVAMPSTSSIVLLLNHGGGAFEQRSLPWPVGPGRLALGDLDGDGVLDLVGVSPRTGQVLVARGMGGATFTDPTSYASAKAMPAEMAIADFDGDRQLDVIVVNSPTLLSQDMPAIDRGSVSIYRGLGDGTLLEPQTFAAGEAPQGLAVSDLDGDGHLDVATVDFWNNGVTVLLGDGAGGLLPGTRMPTGRAYQVIAGDLDGDRRPELVVGRWDDVAVLRNLGAGRFGPAEPYFSGSTQPLAIADLTGDGAADIVVSGALPHVLVQEGGRFTAPPRLDGSWSAHAAVGDLDGDGLPDAVVPQARPGAVAIFRGTQGGFGAPVVLSAPSEPQVVTIGDVDGDGRADLVYAGVDVSVRRNLGGGTFGAESRAYSNLQYSLVPTLADLNGDGFPDIVVAQDSVTANGFEVLLNDGHGNFSTQGINRAGVGGAKVAVGDLDGDGKTDIASGNWAAGTVSIFHGKGDGSFRTPRTIFAGTTYLEAMVTGDVTGDGIADLVVAGGGFSWTSPSQPLVRLFPGSRGGLGGSVDLVRPFYPISLALVDMDSDGTKDVVIGTSSGVIFSRALGAGGFAEPVLYDAGLVQWIAVLDADGDLRPDLLVSDEATRSPAAPLLLYNHCLAW